MEGPSQSLQHGLSPWAQSQLFSEEIRAVFRSKAAAAALFLIVVLAAAWGPRWQARRSNQPY